MNDVCFLTPTANLHVKRWSTRTRGFLVKLIIFILCIAFIAYDFDGMVSTRNSLARCFLWIQIPNIRCETQSKGEILNESLTKAIIEHSVCDNAGRNSSSGVKMAELLKWECLIR